MTVTIDILKDRIQISTDLSGDSVSSRSRESSFVSDTSLGPRRDGDIDITSPDGDAAQAIENLRLAGGAGGIFRGALEHVFAKVYPRDFADANIPQNPSSLIVGNVNNTDIAVGAVTAANGTWAFGGGSIPVHALSTVRVNGSNNLFKYKLVVWAAFSDSPCFQSEVQNFEATHQDGGRRPDNPNPGVIVDGRNG